MALFNVVLYIPLNFEIFYDGLGAGLKDDVTVPTL